MTKIFVVIVTVLGFNLYPQELPVIHVEAQSMIIDKNPLRYIPQNIISNNDGEVFAANASQMDFKNAILRIELSEITEIDSVTFKAGYFDARYYSQNNRIKKIKLELKTSDLTTGKRVSLGFEEFTLVDEMKAQTFKLKKKYKCSSIDLSAPEIIKGEKWDDLVITNVSFSNDGKILTPVIKPNGSQVYYSENKTSYTYNRYNQRIIESHDSGKAGGSSTKYIYGGWEGKRLIAKLYGWDGGDTYRTLLFYKDDYEDSDYPTGEERFSVSGKSVQKKVFTYSGNNLVQENIDGGKKIIKYTYSGNNILSEEWTEGGKITFVKTYFYENGLCVCEYQDNKTKDGWSRKLIYKNIYENGILKTSLLVYFEDDSRGRLHNPATVVYDYIYKDGNLIEKNGGMAW